MRQEVFVQTEGNFELVENNDGSDGRLSFDARSEELNFERLTEIHEQAKEDNIICQTENDALKIQVKDLLEFI